MLGVCTCGLKRIKQRKGLPKNFKRGMLLEPFVHGFLNCSSKLFVLALVKGLFSCSASRDVCGSR